MDKARLGEALAPLVTAPLATRLVEHFLQVRLDFSTRSLGRSAPGKFVETYVQCLQQIGGGAFDSSPDVDRYLATRVEGDVRVGESLRICGARIARAIYTLRNKRNIAHDNEIDPNTFDLAFIHQGTAWIMAELLRTATGLAMEEAGLLVAQIQAPVDALVEEFGETRLVLPDVPVRAELLLLLHSHHPESVAVSYILKSLGRRNSGTVRNRLRDLYDEKLVQGSLRDGYRLTQAGYKAAVSEIRSLAA
jgi:hypothetical protein